MVATVQTDVQPTVTRSVKRPTKRTTPTDGPVILARKAHDPTNVKVKGVGWCDEREAHFLVKKFPGCTCGARNFFHCQCDATPDYDRLYRNPDGWAKARQALTDGVEGSIMAIAFRAMEQAFGTRCRVELVKAMREAIEKVRPDLAEKIDTSKLL